MINPIPSTTVQKLVVGQQRNRLKNGTKRGNSDVPRFRHKDIFKLFHLKLKMLL